MQTLFFILAAYGLFFFTVQRTTFDFVAAGFFGQLIYFMPGFYGYVASPYFTWIEPSIPIAAETYAVWSFAFAATIVTGYLYRPALQSRWPELRTSDGFDIVLIFVIVASFVAELIVGQGAILSPDKLEILEGTNRFFLLFAAASQMGAVAFLVQRKWVKASVPIAAILFLLYAGFRNDLALAMIAVATYVANRRGLWTLVKARYLVPMLSLVLVLFAYKGILVSYRAGRWDILYTMLGSDDYVSKAFLGSEPFITQAILNEVVIRQLTMPATDILYSMIAAIPFFVPLVGLENVDVAFAFQEQLFPNLTYGVASNIYANFYATLGVVGIALFVIVHCWSLVTVSNVMAKAGNPVVRLGVLALGAFLAFYVHRNDLANSLSIINRIAITLFVIWLLSLYVESPFRRLPNLGASKPLAGRK